MNVKKYNQSTYHFHEIIRVLATPLKTLWRSTMGVESPSTYATLANGGIRKGLPFNFHLHKQKYHHCLGQLWQTQIP